MSNTYRPSYIGNLLGNDDGFKAVLAKWLSSKYHSDLIDNKAITIDENGDIWLYQAYHATYLLDCGCINDTFSGASKNEVIKFIARYELEAYLLAEVTEMLNGYILMSEDHFSDEIEQAKEIISEEKHEEYTDLQYSIRSMREDIEEKIDDIGYLLRELENLED